MLFTNKIFKKQIKRCIALTRYLEKEKGVMERKKHFQSRKDIVTTLIPGYLKVVFKNKMNVSDAYTWKTHGCKCNNNPLLPWIYYW